MVLRTGFFARCGVERKKSELRDTRCRGLACGVRDVWTMKLPSPCLSLFFLLLEIFMWTAGCTAIVFYYRIELPCSSCHSKHNVKDSLQLPDSNFFVSFGYTESHKCFYHTQQLLVVLLSLTAAAPWRGLPAFCLPPNPLGDATMGLKSP